ncbi:lysozyme [Pontixanthobacter aestiaquae]|uniref:Lysozyme n=1 Tax=Pontixanthobacter aestiaquae TaxID=1509367 RepID=A0A844ZAT4_9SPHN|nr:lysozyme [Pontixanthobacter aestiaquae]MDN3646049.1 lysozyme [Pontixanthobacter aestiaquae]MXO82959.1 glycoside hydrolase family protein [Pontixanthobacter aestiaquae]
MSQTLDRTPIFSAVRQMLGRGFKQSEVDLLDRAVDQAAGEAEISDQDPVPCVPSCRIGERGIALIKLFEGCARLRGDGMVEAYPDPGTGGDPWTIGWGATGPGLEGQGRIGPGTVWTREECDERLERDLVRYAGDVARALDGAPTTQNQFDALVSFHYNTGAIARATLTKCHKAGEYAAALHEFARWNRAGGRVMRGLTRRRKAEAKLYGNAA